MQLQDGLSKERNDFSVDQADLIQHSRVIV